MIRITIETDETLDGHDKASMLAWQTADELCGNWCMHGTVTDHAGNATRFEIHEDGNVSGEFAIVVKAMPR